MQDSCSLVGMGLALVRWKEGLEGNIVAVRLIEPCVEGMIEANHEDGVFWGEDGAIQIEQGRAGGGQDGFEAREGFFEAVRLVDGEVWEPGQKGA